MRHYLQREPCTVSGVDRTTSNRNLACIILLQEPVAPTSILQGVDNSYLISLVLFYNFTVYLQDVLPETK